ncbi:MAG: hypothetical protein EVJ46_08475 [Candidatus Acididesulfobacter guangdongensis]|uniref:Flagellar protein n=1 Tax=Acididesulfobacter guangdongensis TaxID=2597225 RepID=A0A519BG18_ACIG2|nr:MAG: hypothetical protein EVJ46_08475 [Candidatus Acididesulfobacter guangdongensis]
MRKFLGSSAAAALFILFALLLLFFITGIFAGTCYASGKFPPNSLLQKILVTKNNNGKYLIWLKFNNAAKQLNPNYKLYDYGFKLKFPDSGFHFKSKFLKYSDNPLISGIELIRGAKHSADVMVYFKKGIKINKKRLESSFYGNYYIIKINRSFAGNIFQNVGKKTPQLSKLALLKNSFKNIKKPLEDKPALNKTAPFNKKAERYAKVGQAEKTNKTDKIDKTMLNKQPAAMNFNFGFEIIKTIFSLLLVLGFIYAIYYLLTKFKGKMSNIKKNKNNIRIISSVNIGFKKSLILASVNNQLFLIGVSPTNMQVIGHISDDENNIGSSENDAGENAPAAPNNNIDMMKGIINRKSVNYSKNAGSQSSDLSNNDSDNDNDNNGGDEDNRDIAVNVSKDNAGKFLNKKAAPASRNSFSSFLKQHISALSKDKSQNKDLNVSQFEPKLDRQATFENRTPDKKSGAPSSYSYSNNSNNNVRGSNNNANNNENENDNYNDNDNDKGEESSEYKIRNISEARIKNKADNVFFDIENKIKGLMESNNGNFKKN